MGAQIPQNWSSSSQEPARRRGRAAGSVGESVRANKIEFKPGSRCPPPQSCRSRPRAPPTPHGLTLWAWVPQGPSMNRPTWLAASAGGPEPPHTPQEHCAWTPRLLLGVAETDPSFLPLCRRPPGPSSWKPLSSPTSFHLADWGAPSAPPSPPSGAVKVVWAGMRQGKGAGEQDTAGTPGRRTWDLRARAGLWSAL